MLCIGLLFYAGLMFRAGINTLFFVADTSVDYIPVEATVKKLLPDPATKEGEPQRLIPVFSFKYKGEETMLRAPKLAFVPGQKHPSFKQGQKYGLWVHRTRGELILPPKAGQTEIGRSQMVISSMVLLLAVVIWIIRNRIAAKTAR